MSLLNPLHLVLGSILCWSSYHFQTIITRYNSLARVIPGRPKRSYLLEIYYLKSSQPERNLSSSLECTQKQTQCIELGN